jgi:hypothetical protein
MKELEDLLQSQENEAPSTFDLLGTTKTDRDRLRDLESKFNALAQRVSKLEKDSTSN